MCANFACYLQSGCFFSLSIQPFPFNLCKVGRRGGLLPFEKEISPCLRCAAFNPFFLLPTLLPQRTVAKSFDKKGQVHKSSVFQTKLPEWRKILHCTFYVHVQLYTSCPLPRGGGLAPASIREDPSLLRKYLSVWMERSISWHCTLCGIPPRHLCPSSLGHIMVLSG